MKSTESSSRFRARRIVGTVSIISTTIGGFAITASPAAFAANPSVSVNFSSPTGSNIGHYGGGVLNAINNATITRSNNDYANLNPLEGAALWRGGLPGGTALTPSYDYFDVKTQVDKLSPGQEQEIPNSYESEYPGYTLGQVCTALANKAATAGYNPYWDLINEPDLTTHTWLSTGATDWDACYSAVKAVNSSAKTVGPSISSDNISNVETFLLDQKAKGKLPDVVSFHFPASENVRSEVASLRSFMSANGIANLPVSIQEVLTSSQATESGEAVDYFAASEATQASMTHACWSEAAPPNNNTCEQPMLDGMLDNSGNRRGQWYAYADYAAMSGAAATTTSSSISTVDGLASSTSTSATVLVGAHDGWAGGNVDVTLGGLGSLAFLPGASGSLRMVVQTIPEGTTPADQYISSDSVIAYSGGSTTQTLAVAQNDALRITLLPATTQFTDSVVNDNVNVAARGANGNLWIQGYNTTNASGGGNWTGWTDTGVAIPGTPVIASNASNSQGVYYTDTSGGVTEIWNTGSGWAGNGPYSLGSPSSTVTVQGNPAVVDFGSPNSTVAVRGSDNLIYVDHWNGSAWSGWVKAGASGFTAASSPAIVQESPATLDIFYLDSSGVTQHLISTNSGSTWSSAGSLGGVASGTPAAVSWGPGHIVVAVTAATGGTIYTTRTDDGSTWTGYTSTGQSATGSPALDAKGANHLDLYFANSSGVVEQMTSEAGGSWLGPNAIGNPTGGLSGGLSSVN